ncbi:MAG: bifunctional phosphoribosylaminoimidazolecarboxamide formyltransferase/IMP cyclohydrolase [Ilumatobacteraceae bacterium]
MPRALLSVYDKSGIVEFARSLQALGWEVIASGGTAKLLTESGIFVTPVDELTGYPAILGHRVVTLHPAVHGGILADLEVVEHREDLTRHNIQPIDMVVVGLYPFTSNPGIELIDVGGPALIRAAAKNSTRVTVVTRPDQHETVLTELKSTGGVSDATRSRLAAEAFSLTAHYDSQIANWLASRSGGMPRHISLALEHESSLRYGENPHQQAARYRIVGEPSWWSSVEQLGGKEMSYLNVNDADAAWSLVNRFSEPATVVVKHANPCGVAVGRDIETACRRAYACDPVSAFGGIVALNRPVTRATAAQIDEVFTEVVVAPEFESDALEMLRGKKNLRILRAIPPFWAGWSLRGIDGGVLVQQHDEPKGEVSSWRVVSTARPTDAALRDAALAWVVSAATNSNAIVLAKDGATVGIGAGQQNRVDAVRLACLRAGERANGAVAASDAFFPFRDGPDALAAAGVSLIVQPGGSVRDDESIAAANEHGIAMMFTDIRHFRH